MSVEILAKGIDVSRHNGTINWNKVKNTGIKFVMIRAGYGLNTVDPNFIKNITGAASVGINVGVYWFSYAHNVDTAESEAEFFLKTIEPYRSHINMPVCFDWEETSADYVKKNKKITPTRSLVSDMAVAFLNKVKDAGYYPVNYTNINCINLYYTNSVTQVFDTWLASWSKSYPSSVKVKSVGMWQYGGESNYIDSKYVDGIIGKVDKDYMFFDYPKWYKDKESGSINESKDDNKENDTVIKNYKYSDRIQLTKHFNTWEFKCKCGINHEILINLNLVNKLEELFKAFDCSKIIVNSGYRCPSYDKKITEDNSGQHTLGTAADVTLYDKKGKIIDTKRVSCAAQDLGFSGIASLDNSYTSIHLDIRESGRWYGDRVAGNRSVTNDFYDYFKLTKDQVYNPSSVPVENKYAKGRKITLKNVMLYKSAKATRGKAISGTYWIYDGIEVSGRYRITNAASNVGKIPIGNYVTGFIKKSDIS